MKRERNILRRIFPFFKGRRRVGNAALDSTAWNMKTADYYADAIDQSANQLFDQSTREIAQNRGMHEYLNDPLFFGACQKIASLVCGSNVALKIEGPIKTFGAGDVPDQGAKSQYLEKAFKRFADAIDLLSLIRLLQSSLLYSGEAFIRKVKHETTIEGYSYVFIRPQRVQNPPGLGTDELVNDGILYNSTDDGAEPVAYYVQREKINPLTELGIEYDLVPAGEIIHVFNAILPQQRRGIPEVQTALNIIREIKLLRGLEIQAVKNAAKTSVILTTDAEPIIDAAYSGEEIAVPAPGATGAELPDGVLVGVENPTFNGTIRANARAYLGLTQDATVDAATFENIVIVERSAHLTDFKAFSNATGKITFAVTSLNTDARFLIEELTPRGWATITTEGTSETTAQASYPGLVVYRACDGVNFLQDVAIVPLPVWITTAWAENRGGGEVAGGKAWKVGAWAVDPQTTN